MKCPNQILLSEIITEIFLGEIEIIEITYLIPINFRLPLIFVRGWPKIKGTEKVQLFGWPKIKGTEINSKPFENASSRLDSNFRNIETQK